MKTDWKAKLKITLQNEKNSENCLRKALTKTDKSPAEKITEEISEICLEKALTKADKSQLVETKKILMSAFVSADLAPILKNSSPKVVSPAFDSNNSEDITRKGAIGIKNSQMPLEMSLTKTDKTPPLPSGRVYNFQTAWTGTCFSCDKSVANYYENCPHCGDFPAWF